MERKRERALESFDPSHIGEWVQSVHNHVPDARIILCGTHMDKIPSRKRKQVLQCVCDVMIQKQKRTAQF